MRHLKDGRKLGRTASHRRAMLNNLVTSLFREERVRTTEAKAKEARRLAERLITRARGGSLADRRQVAREIHDEKVLRKLFGELGQRFADRNGGYTRVLKMGMRDGDGARTAVLELVGAPSVEEKEKEQKKKKGKAPSKKEKEAAAKEEKPEKAAKPKTAEKPEKVKKEEEVRAAAPPPERTEEKKEKRRRRLPFGLGRRKKKESSEEK